MNDQIQDLARRAVACKHWRWMSGMRCNRGAGWFRIVDGYTIESPSLDTVPDLTDPATLGCLLALVREVWRSPLIHPRAAGCEWRMWKTEPYAYAYETEEEALVAALEAAP